MSIWDDFSDGLEVGERMGSTLRNQRAYRDGGLDGAAEAAGRVGDLEGREQVVTMQRRQRMFEDDQRNNAYERMETIAPWARNVVRAASAMEPERARVFLSQPQIRQRFMDFGLPEQAIEAGIAGLTNADPAVRQQWREQLDAGFSQHTNPDWQINAQTGQIYAADPATGDSIMGGRVQLPPGEVHSFGSGGLYRNNPQAPNGVEIIREPRAATTSRRGADYPDAETTLRDLGGEWLD